MQLEIPAKLARQYGYLATAVFAGMLLLLFITRLSGSESGATHIRNLVFVEDTVGNQQIEQIKDNLNLPWKNADEPVHNLGVVNHPYWFGFRLPVNSQGGERLLEIDNPLLNQLELWMFSDERMLAYFEAGDTVAFTKRPIAHEGFVFPVPEHAGTIQVYLRVSTSGVLKLPVRLWQKTQFMLFNGQHNLLLGLFFGFILAMAICNLYFFATSRSGLFFTYFGYLACLTLLVAVMQGYAYRYLWPGNAWVQEQAIAVLGHLDIALGILFAKQLLDIGTYSKKTDTLLTGWALLHVFFAIASLVLPFQWMIQALLIMLIFLTPVAFAIWGYLWRQGVPLIRFYVMAWTPMLLCGMLVAIDSLGLRTLPIAPGYLLMFGASLEALLLSLLAVITYTQHKTKTAIEAEDEVARQEDHSQLEYMVQERTLELEITLRELSERNQELEQKNTIDELTNVRNRRYFDRKYQAEVRRSRREQTPLSLVMLDIDHFKQVNDTHGHLVGDDCIKLVAQKIKSHLKRSSDEVCRYGGEEFAIILPNTDGQGAWELVEEIRIAIQNTPLNTRDGQISVTISAGICSGVMLHPEQEQAMLKTADNLLYQAKEAGRNCCKSGALPDVQSVPSMSEESS